MIRRDKMIAMSLRTFTMKVLFFIISNLLSSRRIEVDTQLLNVPKIIISNFCSIINTYLYNSVKSEFIKDNEAIDKLAMLWGTLDYLVVCKKHNLF